MAAPMTDARRRDFYTDSIRTNLAYAERYEAEGKTRQADRRRANVARIQAKLDLLDG